MQPLLTQVPPNRLRSIIATFIPVSASRTARDGPACPVPITIASYLVAIGIPPLGLLSSTVFRVPTRPLRITCTLRPRKFAQLALIDAQDRETAERLPSKSACIV